MFDFNESLAEDFRQGTGKLVLAITMSDREILARVRIALALSEGQPFSVVHCNGSEDVDLGQQNIAG